MAGAELLSALAVLASGDFDTVAPVETAPTCPPGTKPQCEGSLKDADCVVQRGSHITPQTLEPEPHRTPVSRCHPFQGVVGRSVCPDTFRPARGISHRCVVATAAPAMKCVATDSPWAPESSQDLALGRRDVGTGAPVCHCQSGNQTQPWTPSYG